MNRYRQLCAEERVQIATLRSQNFPLPKIAQILGRHRSTIWREVQRNRAPYDGGYRSARAQERAVARRKRSRRNQQFDPAQIARVESLLRQQWSPEQVSGHLRRQGEFSISHETIYRHVWGDLRRGGSLHVQMRGARKLKRKRYGRYDSRGRLAGKRLIGERPAAVETRQQAGHWEIDTVLGTTRDWRRHLGRAPERLLAGGQDARAYHGRTQPGHLRADVPPPGLLSYDHGRQRHGVPRLPLAGSGHGRAVLLRHATPLLGTRHQREHQRALAPVPTQRNEPGCADPESVRRHRRNPQHQTQKKTCLPNTQNVLPCCTTKLMSRPGGQQWRGRCHPSGALRDHTSLRVITYRVRGRL